jgi:hypothetical protein
MKSKTQSTFRENDFGVGAPAEALPGAIVEQRRRPVNLFARLRVGRSRAGGLASGRRLDARAQA